MRAHIAFSLLIGLIAVGCGPSTARRTYTVQGQVLSVEPDHLQATIKHEEIQGLMAAMTMAYKVKDPKLFAAVAPGDLINATLIVDSSDGIVADAYFSDVKKVGEAPLEQKPAASSGFELLKPGEAVPDSVFIDQDGRTRPFSSFKGAPLAITFIYTMCPIPDFCPLMDRQFAAIQQSLESDPALARAHLVSVSFDPINDTPAVLKKHAAELKADPSRWTFLTGDRDAIDRFASRFGVGVDRPADDPASITHRLRTAIIDANGTLVKVYTGNEWKPSQIVADLKAIATPQ
jgi:protein SCO1/2